MNATEQRVNDAALRLFAARGSAEVSISELAAEARVARGTLYRMFDSVDTLYFRVVEATSIELHERVAAGLDSGHYTDPAVRLATGLRWIVGLAHDDPAKGRFIARLGLTEPSLKAVLTGPPMQDVRKGIDSGRYVIESDLLLGVAGLLTGTLISTLQMVIDGHQGWRSAGAGAAELILRALGISPDEARRISNTPLPELP